ncbi:hypothetical protein CS022_00785 [Veronia nyctiphanis]|uniref:Cell wall hydrolase SleB domain-containing protein n=1 Tax=Veronia nyctiphanis TaxID=1278244 RepID=A0A4Q0YU22_9GAMM|nr:LPD7 domain-containing protein [Veronia nyctiphanis]RXJ74792.1 hypothetical protein CS022_00785 [Veronia nyctiphanis]
MDVFAVLALCSALGAGQGNDVTNDKVDCKKARAVYQSQLRSLALSNDDRDAIGRVAYAEASNQGDAGLAGVIYTILNRYLSGRFGRSIQAIINAPYQFEPVHRSGGWRRLPKLSAVRQTKIDTIINLALDGRLPDPTNGALYFQNPSIVASRERKGTVSKGLTHFGGARPSSVIKDHYFYPSMNTSGKLPARKYRSMEERYEGFGDLGGSKKYKTSHDYASSPEKGLSSYYSQHDGNYYLSSRYDSPAFVSEGDEIKTELNDPKVASSIVDIALAKNWTEISVQGTDDFKRQIWLEASTRGLKVIGYDPGLFDYIARLTY